ncbi:uncharacterized protein LOC126971883 [Leptidea sinapis]|uniref:uncharacterized protein LOC126971883 n=1 Tax=Leptidea sinapis TaxID=189913 RepID=UPI0021C2AA75|nr:uncharacterized protein LOC126971883 [Leptidea sinapis]
MSKPRYVELDDEEEPLFRHAFETPSYNQDDCDDNDILDSGNLDLLKDGLWALKAKMKQLKAFNKVLATNLLSTKLRLKEIVESAVIAKKHKHEELEKKKPLSYYQTYSYEGQYPPYGAGPYGLDPYYGI